MLPVKADREIPEEPVTLVGLVIVVVGLAAVVVAVPLEALAIQQVAVGVEVPVAGMGGQDEILFRLLMEMNREILEGLEILELLVMPVLLEIQGLLVIRDHPQAGFL
jgi:hypothetical protein